MGSNVAGNREDTKTNGYDTAPGVVFAYRLHVIRPKGTGSKAELFSDRNAFCGGEAEDEDEDEDVEMEMVEVGGETLPNDLDIGSDGYEILSSSVGDNEYLVVFKSSTMEQVDSNT